jgi:hypothetical protein
LVGLAESVNLVQYLVARKIGRKEDPKFRLNDLCDYLWATEKAQFDALETACGMKVNCGPINCPDNLFRQSHLSRSDWAKFVNSFDIKAQSEPVGASKRTMNQASPAIVLDTFEAFLSYKPRGVQRARTGSSSTATTIPANPRQDFVNIRVWEDFSGAVEQMYTELRAGNQWKRHVTSFPVYLPNGLCYKVKKEMTVASVHSKTVLEPVHSMCDSLGIRGSFLLGDNGAALNPDSVWVQSVQGDDEHDSCRLVLELKTPWAFPSVPDGDLAGAYRAACQPSASKCMFLADPKRILMHQSIDPSPQSPQRKVKNAVEQLWAYMTVNHLLYGVLSTHQETYFFRRHDPNTTPSHSTAQLEISLAISHDSEPPVTLMAAWLYMLQAVNKQYFYASPFSTPSMRRARKISITYERRDLGVSDVYFGQRLLVHGAAGTAVDGHCGPYTNCIMKLVDGLNGPKGSVDILQKEVRVFQRLESLQGTVIPRFYQYGMLWDWLHLIAMEDCGEPLHEDEIAGHAGKIRELVQALHDNGVLHGDVRKANILKDGQGQIRLIDFSHSKFQGDDGLDWDRECQQELATIDTLNEID